MNSVVKLREILEEATSTFEEFQEVLQHTELTGDDANMLLRKAADHYLNARNPKADFRKYLEVLVEYLCCHLDEA